MQLCIADSLLWMVLPPVLGDQPALEVVPLAASSGFSFWWLLIFHKSRLGFSSGSCKTEQKCPQPSGLRSEVECWKVSHVLLAKACYKGSWDLRAGKQTPTLHKSGCAYLKITIFATSSLSCLSFSLTFTLCWLIYLLGTYYRYLYQDVMRRT